MLAIHGNDRGGVPPERPDRRPANEAMGIAASGTVTLAVGAVFVAAFTGMAVLNATACCALWQRSASPAGHERIWPPEFGADLDQDINTPNAA